MRKSDAITDAELDDNRLIRRLFLQRLDDLEIALGAKCKSCNNTWYIRGIVVALVLISAWISTLQASIPVTPDTVIKAVADEGIKRITKVVP